MTSLPGQDTDDLILWILSEQTGAFSKMSSPSAAPFMWKG